MFIDQLISGANARDDEGTERSEGRYGACSSERATESEGRYGACSSERATEMDGEFVIQLLRAKRGNLKIRTVKKGGNWEVKRELFKRFF